VEDFLANANIRPITPARIILLVCGGRRAGYESVLCSYSRMARQSLPSPCCVGTKRVRSLMSVYACSVESSSSAQREKALVALAQARPVFGNLKTK
jgi:hypothetical protein